jgi:hypothetical protein
VSEGLAHHEKNQIAGHVALLRAQRALSVLALFQLDDGRVCGSTSLRGSGENSSGGTISSSDDDDDDSSGGTSNRNRAEGEGYQPSSSAGLSSGGGRGGVPSVLNVPLPASVSLWPCVPPLVLGRALSLIGRCVEATAQALNIARDLPYSTSSYTSSVMCAPPTPLFMESDPEERGACKEENGSTGVTSEPTTSAHSCGSERENFEAALTMLQTNVLHVCFGAKVQPQVGLYQSHTFVHTLVTPSYVSFEHHPKSVSVLGGYRGRGVAFFVLMGYFSILFENISLRTSALLFSTNFMYSTEGGPVSAPF